MWSLAPDDFDTLWGELSARFDRRALGRVGAGLAGLVGASSDEAAGDEMRRVRNFWLPDLPSKPWWPAEEAVSLSGCDPMALADAVLRDYETARAGGLLLSGYETAEAEAARTLIDPRNDTPLDQGWQALALMRDGQWRYRTAACCPAALSLLDRVPLYPGDAIYSVLAPRTEIPPHNGLDNLTLTVHLPLLVPEDCGIEVAGQSRRWREGEVLVFDDSYLHRAWNGAAEARVVLLFDIWHPCLTDTEVAALRHVWLALRRMAR